MEGLDRDWTCHGRHENRGVKRKKKNKYERRSSGRVGIGCRDVGFRLQPAVRERELGASQCRWILWVLV